MKLHGSEPAPSRTQKERNTDAPAHALRTCLMQIRDIMSCPKRQLYPEVDRPCRILEAAASCLELLPNVVV